MLKPYEDSIVHRDEAASAPIYNYARFLPWVSNVELVAGAFRAAAEKATVNEPVNRNSAWTVTAKGEISDNNRRGTPEQVRRYIRSVTGKQGARLDADIVKRFLTASALGLFLQWGTIGGAIVIVVSYLPVFE